MSAAARSFSSLSAGAWIALAVCILMGLFASALLVPELIIPNDAPGRLKRENEVRAALIQGFALIGLLLTAGVGYRNIQVTKQGQISERYGNAVDLLGDDAKLASRLGGIFALEQIARASSEDHLTVIELLGAFTRVRAQGIEDGNRVRPDVQAALTVIGRRNTGNDPPKYRLHLNGIKAPQVRLRDARLADARLRGTHLEMALFDDADLTNADFAHAHLEKAHLERATLRHAVFAHAHLSGAQFDGADLTGANFTDARIDGAAFDGANGKGVTWVDGSSRDFLGAPSDR